MHRPSLTSFASLACAACIAFAAAPARAGIVDLSLEAGLEKRSLSITEYSPGLFVQANVEFGIIPGLLYLGPYASYAQLQPQLATQNGADIPNAPKFYGGGLRARLVIPLPDIPIKPYGFVGGGVVHSDVPDQTVNLCTPTVLGQQACQPETLPAATANFAELTFGVGARLDFSDTVRVILEGAWKPTFGYQNDSWENAAHGTQSGNLSLGTPGRNGYALSASAGLMISL
jgi:hypothetical protein